MMILIDRIKRNPCRTFWFLGGGLFLIFIIWYNILPVPLFQDPYATVLLDREGQVMGMKVADDGQMRFEGFRICLPAMLFLFWFSKTGIF